MLRPLHISRAIRYGSLDICIDLANHHIRALEFSLAVENTARVNMPDLSEFAPSFLAGSMLESRPFYQRLARLGETMSLKANKADALYGFLKKMKVPVGVGLTCSGSSACTSSIVLACENEVRLFS
jgi:hypothetical protein